MYNRNKRVYCNLYYFEGIKMTIIDFLNVFKDATFSYNAKGFDGGKNSQHLVSFHQFGLTGPNAYFPNTFNFIVQHEIDGKVIKEELNFKNLSSISEDVLSMELVDIKNITLGGNNRTTANFFNDHSSITIICRPLLK
jgi:hypothetical protein